MGVIQRLSRPGSARKVGGWSRTHQKSYKHELVSLWAHSQARHGNAAWSDVRREVYIDN